MMCNESGNIEPYRPWFITNIRVEKNKFSKIAF